VPDVRRLAHDFAETIRDLLNGTVCDGITVQAYVYKPDHLLVGHGLSKESLEVQPFRLRIGPGRPHGWMEISYRLRLDDESQYLTVASSYVGIYADDADRSLLCHVDYERDKPHGYPEAHIQVEGTSAALAAWRLTNSAAAPPLRDLHFPVGGRRYRPALEDIIEFLIAEKLAAPRPGWESVLNTSRGDFRRLQLLAAIRRDLPTATQAVRELSAARKATRSADTDRR
jgi:hypothetical protein